MGGLVNDPADGDTSVSASFRVICQEFLKVLGRKEVEQPLICQEICACAQFWRYQHYFLPLWDWGVKKMVCLNLGSFKNVRENGGPFPDADPEVEENCSSYRDVIRNTTLLAEFNARPVDRHDALQAMLRHVAAIEMASMLKFCASKRGIEHELIKFYFKKLSAIKNLPESGEEVDEKVVKKLGKMPVTAGYAGDEDLTDVPVYLCDAEYTDEDKIALGILARIFKMAHLPPVKGVGAGELEGGSLVDEHTLVYAVDPDLSIGKILGGSKPAVMICNGRVAEVESSVTADGTRSLLDDYEEFELDRIKAPHTIGSSHLYIRKDIVERAEKEKIVPPYPVTFPHDYPSEHQNWYLNKLARHGSGRVVKAGDGDAADGEATDGEATNGTA